jgi:hypothetical protein
MRKGNDEIYQLAKDLALVKKLENNKRFRPFCLCPPGVMYYNKYNCRLYPPIRCTNVYNLSLNTYFTVHIIRLHEQMFKYLF